MKNRHKYDNKKREEMIREVQEFINTLQPLDTLKCECLDMILAFKTLYDEFIFSDIYTQINVSDKFKIDCTHTAKNLWEKNQIILKKEKSNYE